MRIRYTFLYVLSKDLDSVSSLCDKLLEGTAEEGCPMSGVAILWKKHLLLYMPYGVGHITKNSGNVFSACRKRRLKETGRGNWESPPLYIFPQRQHERRGVAVRLSSPRTLVVGSLNVRGCSSIESKRCEIGCMFGRKGMDVLVLCETKMKGK